MREQLGLSQTEEQVYLSVLRRGGADTSELAQLLTPAVAAGVAVVGW